MEAIDGARRAFLRGAFLGPQGREEAQRRLPPWGPPPPGLEQAGAEGACADCDRPCASACPQGIIRVHPPGHALARRPYLSFATAGCTFCAACADACPALPRITASTVSRIAAVLGRARLDASRCLAWNQVVCMSCRGRCGHRALYFDARSRPGIDQARCTGCGGCVSACPVQAITVHPPGQPP